MPEEKKSPPPAAERRGGDKPVWEAVQPGEELPEFPDAAPPVVIQSEYEPEG